MIIVIGVVEIATVLSLILSLLPISGVSTLIYTTYLPSSSPYTWIVDGLCRYLSHQPRLEVFWGGCKAAIILCRDHFLINAVIAAFPKIFWDSSLSFVLAMLIHISRTSWIAPLDGRHPLRTSALASWGQIHPRHKLLGHYVQYCLPYPLAWVSLAILTYPRTAPYPRLGP